MRYIRKVLLFIVMFLLFCPFGWSWGFLDWQYEGATLLYKLIGVKNPKINVCVYENKYDDKKKDYVNIPITQEKVKNEYIRLTKDALNEWFTTIKVTISDAKRTDEFADLFSLLPENIQLVPSKTCKENELLKLVYAPTESSVRGTASCSDKGVCEGEKHHNKVYTINLHQMLSSDKNFQYSTFYSNPHDAPKIVKHEVGHLLGLSDQYTYEARNGLFGTSDRNDNSMMGYANKGNSFTADDIDGMINAVDFAYSYTHPNKISARIKNGWKGFKRGAYYNYMMLYVASAREIEQKNRNKVLWEQLLSLKDSYMLLGEYSKNLSNEESKLLALKKEDIPITTLREELTKAQLETMMVDIKLQYIKDLQIEVEKLSEKLEDFLEHPKDNPNYFSDIRELLNSFRQKNPQIPNVVYNKDRLNAAKTLILVEQRPICAICEQPISSESGDGIGTYTKRKGGKIVQTLYYYAHLECSKDETKNPKEKYSSKKKLKPWDYQYQLAYKDIVADLENYDSNHNLQASIRDELATNMSTQLPTSVVASMPYITERNSSTLSTPVNTPTVAGQSVTKPKNPTTVPDAKPLPIGGTQKIEQPTGTSSHVHSASEVPVSVGAAKKKIGTCEVCGKDIIEGESFYQRTSSRYSHKGNECAYATFARLSKVDDASLARYEDYYFFKVPEDVTKAKGLMKELGLTVGDIRRYRSEKETEQNAEKERLQKAAEIDNLKKHYQEICSFIPGVTSEDVSKYAKDNAKVLREINKKEREKKTLTSKQQKVQKRYKKLISEYAKRMRCEKLEKQIQELNK